MPVVSSKIDTRPPRGGWAPGGYACSCLLCKAHFQGDKRATSCADCAYTVMPKPKTTPHRVYKYPLSNQRLNRQLLPKGSKILHFDMQDNEPCLWAQCSPDKPLEERFFGVFPTGVDIYLPDIPAPLVSDALESVWHAKHIGTYLDRSDQNPSYALVWHCFEFVPVTVVQWSH